jgi:hypothetical protein
MQNRCDDNSVVGNALRNRLRRRLLRATLPAIRQLARAAAGERVFENDHHLRACVALARLTPMLVAPLRAAGAAREEPVEINPLHPAHWGQEKEIIRRMTQLHEEALAAKAAGRLVDGVILKPEPGEES